MFETQGATLRAVHSPGHTTDHMAFVLGEEDALFTGDNVLGHGTAVFEDLAAYISSLRRMTQTFSGRAYPGHGAVLDDGVARIKEYIAHRAQREREVLEVLTRLTTGENNGRTVDVMETVAVIYKDTPKDLWVPASKGVTQVLWKLKDEGKTWYDDKEDKWCLTSRSAL